MSETPKTLVTGGAGFIGSHLVKELIVRGYRVTILDDLSTGSVDNIRETLVSGRAELVRGSITDTNLLTQCCLGVRYLFHLAAISRVPQSVADPVSTHEVNINGTLKVLLAARQSGVAKFIYASSSSVYGENPELPQHEEMVPQPVSPYAVSKLVGEHYAGVFQQIYGLPTVSLRFFNAYGSHQDPDSPYSNVIPLFIRRITQGIAPLVFDDGEQSRDFVYVKDIVRAALLVAESEASGTFNIGSGQGTSVNQLLAHIGEIIGCKVEPEYRPPRPGDPKHTLADIRRAAKIGYRPEYDIARGLREVVPYYAATG